MVTCEACQVLLRILSWCTDALLNGEEKFRAQKKHENQFWKRVDPIVYGFNIQNPYFWSINRNNLGFINLLDSWILRKFWADSNFKHDIYPPNVSKRHLGGKLFWNRKVASDRICHHHSRDDPSILTFSDTPLDWGYLGMLQGHVGVLLDSTFAYIWTIFGNHRR